MYKSSGVVVLDSFPIRQIDIEVLDSIAASIEEGILYALITQGDKEYKSPFTFSQIKNWVDFVLDSPRIIIVDLPLSSFELNNTSNTVLTISKTLSNINNLPFTEPLTELCCYTSGLIETNPYINTVKQCFKEHNVINIDGMNDKLSRKQILEEMLVSDNVDKYFNLLTPKSYRSVINYKESLKN
jgi:hypothetical protein